MVKYYEQSNGADTCVLKKRLDFFDSFDKKDMI
jgi:hypothetical protein